ncbi:hypothetical protein [Paractinoplanes toevensis]|uniref:Uncharacterized protein n=1 Tax=Paractinoplanes toevensis TaxID=571911 RepID=A0A919WCY3_9ACTN|nr:hypothetical protein [Actinoplanes toevensis]GIM97847.1 hypothetical protein Ato02nite_096400 [Actinoplanes toevensis]
MPVVSTVLTAVGTAVVTAVLSAVVPQVEAATRSAVNYVIGGDRPCGSGTARHAEDLARRDVVPTSVHRDQVVRIFAPDAAGCHAILASREPNRTFTIHGECTNSSGVPGDFRCKLQPSKLCKADGKAPKLTIWMSIFAVDNEGLQRLVSSEILGAEVPAGMAGYERFKKIVGEDRIVHSEEAAPTAVEEAVEPCPDL